ncbi:HlyD family secretion protein [Aquimarina algicola]|uniref:HlyD family efflux transporter periplasmic adaptor subunit n=1 Tax=Aquimarina algicola TaxID=2589995 RepID=A0A504J6P0_9FLAO|nr:HlyD family efflux transporter periplasmic adaptor subunit [Aquimarina algicola]TPN82759.1 HlyD family efflux transporter periplasmic adaptor subunit [Aquimarina algicola]
MNPKLFRKEVFKHKSQRLYGEVLLKSPRFFWLYTITITILVIVALLLLFYGTYSRKESVKGYLIPDKGLVKLYPSYSGIIKRNFIIEGQKVKKNQLLMEIGTERLNADSISSIDHSILRLQKQSKNLSQQIEDEKKLMLSEESRLTQKLINLTREYQQILKQLKINKSQYGITEKQRDQYEMLLSKGIVDNDDYRIRQTGYFNAKNSLESTRRLKIIKETEISNAKIDLEQLPIKKENSIKELIEQKSQVEEKLVEVTDRKSFAIKSPVNGRVIFSQFHVGQKANPNLSLLTILPEKAELFADLFLPSRAIGFVKKNQNVLIRFDAFPYQRYGLHNGKIIQVAKAAINPNEIETPLSLQEPVYRVKVALDKQYIKAFGKKVFLQPSMSVDAEIILEDRSLGEWLLEPIYSLKGRF